MSYSHFHTLVIYIIPVKLPKFAFENDDMESSKRHAFIVNLPYKMNVVLKQKPTQLQWPITTNVNNKMNQ